jgi:uncharacterized protein YxeA
MIKKIIILILVLIVIAISFWYFFSEEKIQTVSEQNTVQKRFTEDTTNNNPPQAPQPETVVDMPNGSERESEISTLSENELYLEIKKDLKSWEETRDSSFLHNALKKSEGSSNELSFEAWVPFIKNYSSSLVQIIESENPGLIETVYLTLDWFIYLSGEFEKMSIKDKEEISGDYFKAKKLFEKN